ncbi:retrovirus-related pol polyprotein from transposon TNT 1-94 [Tanacetum coccineum]|uniref:Retrovirus-related pol polyprotein from transposon TNT 1-94 n=1 Tax=Tanacetum coccineum TaxID=301880 RepID=A0ABQ5B169_9ASTR
MLDKADFASWKQRIRLYCRGKDNGVNILKSIDEGHFQMGTTRGIVAEGTEGSLNLGLERPRVYSDLSQDEKDSTELSTKLCRTTMQKKEFLSKDFPRTPQQNRRCRKKEHTLVELQRQCNFFPRLRFSFLWAEAVAIACYTQNRSLIHTHHDKTPYELVHNKKPDLTFFRVFGALYYPTNDSEDLGKLQPTADIRIFVGYAPSRKGYRIYNKRTQQIMKTIQVQFDELTEHMAPVQSSLRPAPNLLTPGPISSGLVPNPAPAIPYVPPTNKELEMLFQPMFDEYFNPPGIRQDPIPNVA